MLNVDPFPSHKEGTGNLETRKDLCFVPLVYKPQGLRKGLRMKDLGTVDHVRGALGPTETPSFVAAVLSPSRWAQAKDRVGRKKTYPILRNEVIPRVEAVV